MFNNFLQQYWNRRRLAKKKKKKVTVVFPTTLKLNTILLNKTITIKYAAKQEALSRLSEWSWLVPCGFMCAEQNLHIYLN